MYVIVENGDGNSHFPHVEQYPVGQPSTNNENSSITFMYLMFEFELVCVCVSYCITSLNSFSSHHFTIMIIIDSLELNE